GNRRDKPTIVFDPEIEKTLKKNRSRVKAQRALQFDQEEVNSEECASEKSFEQDIVWPNVDANNFELKPALVQLVQQNKFGGNPLDDQ
ncbi:hypothetical protein PIB30_059416, partial [Stylosanthes scabra]|nr:hypothetical protein [Stylosanthes scabra]